jgi:3-hydroxyisobutyryl-CoA hydrolase
VGVGAAMALHAAFPIATEDTRISMSETGIGWFVDCGMSYIFSRLENNIGMYLALTGHVLNGSDLM